MCSPPKVRRAGTLMFDEKFGAPGKETALPAFEAQWPAADHTKSPNAAAET